VEGVTRTTAGLLRGVEEPGAWVFRGVPYARTGAGAGRWCPPSPADPWTGTRDAAVWGPIAPQPPPAPGFSLDGDPTLSDENCLNLNVWSPRLDDGGRPVLVWVHGGGFTTGTGASVLFSGQHLAARGVVVVTFNYRLGALGLLAHPDLIGDTGSGWGNWCLHDQIAALRWVQENIAAFGGDPGNVSLVGESAGAMSVAALLAAPEAAGLFHRAVLQSGPPATCSPDWGRRRTERLAGHLGLPLDALLSLHQTSPGRLVEGVQRLAAEAPADGDLPLPLLPVVDGVLLDRPPGDAVVEGSAAAVPLLLGSTRDESALFVMGDPSAAALDEARVVSRLSTLVGRSAAQEVVDAYREARGNRGEPSSARDLWTAVTTDYVFRLPLQVLAAAHANYESRTFSYLFTWESPFLGGAFGSCHGLDIPFVFGTVQDPAVQPYSGSGSVAMALSEAMQQAWIAFARSGDPSCDALGEWPPYDTTDRPTMVLGPGCGVESDPRAPERAIWEDVGVDVGTGHHHQ